MKDASESLAGRVNFIHMGGLDCEEVGIATRNRLWLRGGFPESYLRLIRPFPALVGNDLNLRGS
jgi:predicted AAA+ superfamily ATPase